MLAKLRHLILAITACSALMAPSYAQPVPIAVARGPVSLLVYVAEARGFFAKEGVDIRQVACTSGKECLKLLRDGIATFATCADLLVALDGLAPEGPGVRILATISTSSSQIKVVGRSSAGIRAPTDFVGKRVGTVRGSSAQYLLHLWLAQHRIEASAIQEVHALAPELAPMFVRRSA